ncbi:hypothetical protein ABIC22_002032 [Paenibacillus sp. PvP094]
MHSCLFTFDSIDPHSLLTYTDNHYSFLPFIVSGAFFIMG